MCVRLLPTLLIGLLLSTAAAPHASAQEGLLDTVGTAAQDSFEHIKNLLRAHEDVEPAASADPYLDEQKRLERHAGIIAKMHDGVGDVLDLREAQEQAPESSFNPLTETKADIQDEIIDVLDELALMLLDDGIITSVDEIDRLRDRQRDLRNELASLREARFAAPEQSVWQTSKTDIDEDIAEAQENIEVADRQIALIKAQIALRFEAIGVDLTEAQIDQLLTRVDGGDIIGLTVMIKTVADMTEVLKTLMAENAGSLEFARRYYAASLVLRELIVHAQNGYIDRVDELWLPRLDEIDQQLADAINSDRESLSDEHSATRKRIFETNIQQSQRALDILHLYRERLVAQRERVAETREEALRDVAAAFSTYKSVSLSSLLINLVEESATTFEELMRLQIPEIIPFDDPVLEDKFRELTDELRGTS